MVMVLLLSKPPRNKIMHRIFSFVIRNVTNLKMTREMNREKKKVESDLGTAGGSIYELEFECVYVCMAQRFVGLWKGMAAMVPFI